MAKYDVMFSCGHEDEVELLGKHSERRKKIEYFERSGLCRECYKKKMQKLEQEKPFVFNISALPYIDDEGNILLTVWFSGNTREYKDDIKSWLVEKHHYFCYEKGYIDDYSLDCMERRYRHYADEGGNSYAATLMAEVRALPKMSMMKDGHNN